MWLTDTPLAQVYKTKRHGLEKNGHNIKDGWLGENGKMTKWRNDSEKKSVTQEQLAYSDSRET